MPCCGGVGVLVAIRPSPPTLTDDLALTAQQCSKTKRLYSITGRQYTAGCKILPAGSGALRDCAVGVEWRRWAPAVR